jgi:uncharacterized Zn finger protein (UPF0148 family)
MIRIQCPSCKHTFTIEPTKLEREVDRLKLENARLRRELKDIDGLAQLKDIFGGFK